MINLLADFILTGLLGTYAGILFQERFEAEKLRAITKERLVEKCKRSLDATEDVLA